MTSIAGFLDRALPADRHRAILAAGGWDPGLHAEPRRIANQKLPERLEVVAELPRTARGKVQKFRLREDVRRRLAGVGAS